MNNSEPLLPEIKITEIIPFDDHTKFLEMITAAGTDEKALKLAHEKLRAYAFTKRGIPPEKFDNMFHSLTLTTAQRSVVIGLALDDVMADQLQQGALDVVLDEIGAQLFVSRAYMDQEFKAWKARCGR